MKILLIFTALIVGGLLPIQGAVNAHLGKSLNHPLQASFISFFGAVIILLALLFFLNPPIPRPEQLAPTPWYYFTGGIYGAAFVTLVLVLVPRIGVANTLAATIAGQLIMSVFLDHFGVLGLQQRLITLPRLLGCLGLIGSMLLIQRT